ncbi:type II secretion system F family protein [candidate division WWE3 bacterium]|nr:type II secretion system F family protein [candidate division WWE3 bacterium]
MPVYNYTAIDAPGKKRTGQVDARSQSSAVTLLKEQGLYVVTLDEQKEDFVTHVLSFRGVPEAEVVGTTRQLATMINAGLPISRALEVMADQTQNRNMRKVLQDVLRDVQGGSSLSNSLGKYPNAFDQTYVSLVRAGEASGKLDEILKRLADTVESQRDFKSRFKGAMIYPAIIMVAMVGVFILMMVFVIPKLSQMYTSMGVELPTPTKVMIGISDFMVKFWYLVVLGIGALFFTFRSVATTPRGRETLNLIFSKMPIFGKLIIQKDLTEFTRTLSLLISSGIPITEALNIVSKVVTNPNLRQGSMNAAMAVEKGGSLSDFLKTDKHFPPLLGQMAAVGEETGQLDDVLGRIGTFYASETDHAIKGLSSALEPIILILLGGMVGLLIVSIITPIYKITSAL